MALRLVLILLALGFATGCDKTIGDFVDGAKEVVPPEPDDDDETTTASPAIKMSPGRVTSASVGAGAISMDATVTPTRRVMTDTDMSAVITINQSRSQ